MKNHLVIILLLVSLKSFACSCKTKTLSEWQKYELENSDYIFIGEVIEVNNSDFTFKIKVLESLDGRNSIGAVYIGKNWKNCSPYVKDIGKWIVYGNIKDGFLRLNMCGISRSFDNPIVNALPLSPELYEKNKTEKKRKKISKKLHSENMKIALSDLELEVIALRKRRDNE